MMGAILSAIGSALAPFAGKILDVIGKAIAIVMAYRAGASQAKADDRASMAGATIATLAREQDARLAAPRDQGGVADVLEKGMF